MSKHIAVSILAHLKKLDVQPGDTLVLELPADYPILADDQLATMEAFFRRRLGFDVDLIITPPGAKLEKLPIVAMPKMDLSAEEIEKLKAEFHKAMEGAAQPGAIVVLPKVKFEPLTLNVKTGGFKVKLPPELAACADLEAAARQCAEAVETVSGYGWPGSWSQVKAESTTCPQGHHLKDGPCRRDYCLCHCPRCEAQCAESG